jgi:PAS domain S-box-containing protein
MSHDINMTTGMTAESEVLGLQFAANAHPMWIVDRNTDVFLDVNDVAVQRYGYSRQEFLTMTSLDIRPNADIPALLQQTVDSRLPGPSTGGKWRHQAKNGSVFPVAITSWSLTFRGRHAQLVLARRESGVVSGTGSSVSEGNLTLGGDYLSSPATTTAMGRSLLVCNDSVAIQLLAEGMQRLAIATEIYDEVSMAVPLLTRQKFEAVIVDSGLGQAGEILEQVRLSPSNRSAVTFAITEPQKRISPQFQANFVLERPLSAGSVGRTLKAAFGLIIRERRRSFRCPVTIPAVVVTNGKQANCQVVNISEAGMSIAGSPSLKSGDQIKVLFTLPGQRDRFTVESEVRWCDEKGRAGLRSLLISSEQQHVLQEWIAAKLEEDLPESVASQFRKQ